MTNREIQVIRILGMSLLIGLITIILKPKCIFDGASNQQIFTAFIGALLALALNLIIRLIYFKNRLIRTYACAGTRNNGTETEFEGELMHHYGEPGNENSNEVWIHRKNSFECGKPIQFKKDATLYGPYSTDCGNPGYYKAVFRVKFNPGTNSRTEYKNLLLFQFDVFCFRQIHSKLDPKEEQMFLGKIFLRFEDFRYNDWMNVEVPFYSSGFGMLEYRALAFNGADRDIRPDNFSKLPHDFAFYFDWVKIYRVDEGRLF